ncbi:MAG: competence/damage-inducible protein A, partial [Legionellaceae bacterium]
MKPQKIAQKNKTIAFLAIGNELVEGQIQDTNSFHFSGLISAEGGTVRHQRQVTDNTQDIVDDVHDLLSKNEVLIITGGLGPTSDDKTRHAISEALDLPLVFDEPSWDYIKARLTQFGLAIAPSNRQQALFPQGATILDNEQGSARGAHIKHKGCDLFMLPGPPNECWPMFDAYVLPFLKHHHFFKAHHALRFLTLGLIEGEIAPWIDDIAEPFQAKTGYRWTYPYIEIKLKVEQLDHIEPLRALILEHIKDHLVSSNDNDAFAILKQNLLPETTPTLTVHG